MRRIVVICMSISFLILGSIFLNAHRSPLSAKAAFAKTEQGELFPPRVEVFCETRRSHLVYKEQATSCSLADQEVACNTEIGFADPVYCKHDSTYDH